MWLWLFKCFWRVSYDSPPFFWFFIRVAKNILTFLANVLIRPVDIVFFSTFRCFLSKVWFSEFIHLSVLHIGVLDKPGSKFTGIFWLYCHQVPEDPPCFETSQSSVQIWGHEGEKYVFCPLLSLSATNILINLINILSLMDKPLVIKQL